MSQEKISTAPQQMAVLIRGGGGDILFRVSYGQESARSWPGTGSALAMGCRAPKEPDVQGLFLGSDGRLVCPTCCWFELGLSFPSSTGKMLCLLPSLPSTGAAKGS